MQLSRSAKGTIAFSLALALTVIYCTTNAICMSEPRSPLIPTFGRFFGPVTNSVLVAPLTLVLTGAIILGLWNSSRNAFMLALAVGAVTLVIYLLAGVAYLVAGSFGSALICASVIASAGLATGYGFKGWREVVPLRSVST